MIRWLLWNSWIHCSYIIECKGFYNFIYSFNRVLQNSFSIWEQMASLTGTLVTSGTFIKNISYECFYYFSLKPKHSWPYSMANKTRPWLQYIDNYCYYSHVSKCIFVNYGNLCIIYSFSGGLSMRNGFQC